MQEKGSGLALNYKTGDSVCLECVKCDQERYSRTRT